MKDIEKVLKLAQKLLYCPVCKRKFKLQEIKLYGWLNNTYFLKIYCNNDHEPITMGVVLGQEPVNKNLLNIFNQGITKKVDQRLQMRKALDHFDGDFEKLWKK